MVIILQSEINQLLLADFVCNLLLLKDFTRAVLIANVVAWPLAYVAMNKWLQNFAYRIDIGWGTCILAGLGTFIIALMTVSYQSIKAALANPIKSLRYE